MFRKIIVYIGLCLLNVGMEFRKPNIYPSYECPVGKQPIVYL